MRDRDIVDRIHHIEQQRRRLDAELIRAITQLNSVRDTKYVGDEVAAVLDWAPVTASGVVHRAVELATRLPDTVDALADGRLDLRKAHAILEWTESLPVEQAREVAGRMHEWVAGRPIGALRAKLSREVIKIDPEGAERRRQAKIKQRKLSFFAETDGMASLYLYDTAERVRAIYDMASTVARHYQRDGHPGDLDALRADGLGDLVLGPQHSLQVELRVTVPASVLAGVSNAPGWLHGYGPITSATIWELAQHHPFWRRVVTDPATGTVMEVSKRQAPESLRDYIQTRTTTCTAPGCRRPAESCDLDHLTDHAKGGATSDATLGPACRHHSVMKLNGGWRVDQPEPGVYRWTNPAELYYDTQPDLVDPEPE